MLLSSVLIFASSLLSNSLVHALCNSEIEIQNNPIYFRNNQFPNQNQFSLPRAPNAYPSYPEDSERANNMPDNSNAFPYPYSPSNQLQPVSNFSGKSLNFIPDKNTAVEIRTKYGDLALSINNDKKLDKNLLISSASSGSGALFNITTSFNNRAAYEIKLNDSSKRVWDVVGGSKRPGAKIILFSRHGQPNQQFLINFCKDEEGYFKLVSVNSNLCIALGQDGTLEQRACNDSDAEKFYFVRR